MKHLVVFLLVCFYGSISLCAQNIKSKRNHSWQVYVDLKKVENDRLKVVVIPPKTGKDSLVYHFPAIVPGTYTIYDFGRYISGFRAYSKNGDTLPIERLNVNSWKISDAKKLAKLEYLVDDTWESPEIKGENIFEPAGSNIEEGQVYLLNTFSFCGFSKEYQDVPYQLHFQMPAGFKGSSSLTSSMANDSAHSFVAGSYADLADAPILFSAAKTVDINVGGASVSISVYSPSGKMTSAMIAKRLQTLLNAQAKYLGGSLPVTNYSFLFYFTPKMYSGRFGALEHKMSSVYFLPEALSESQLLYMINDIAAHEFFHIVTPLNLQSKEIKFFDFAQPSMSKHLWLYEGITEYQSHYMQLQNELIDLQSFLVRMIKKLNNASKYNDSLPFTEMSAKVLKEYKDQYPNVYEKGALIGFCLDVLIRKNSIGEKGIQYLLTALTNKYGKKRAFNDDDLFKDIESLTYPEVGDFLRKCVGGGTKIPYKEIVEYIGIEFKEKHTERNFSLGASIGLSPSDSLFHIVNVSTQNPFVAQTNLKKGDIIKQINDVVISKDNLFSCIDDLYSNAKEGDTVTLSIDRKNPDNSIGEKQLVGVVKFTDNVISPMFRLSKTATEAQRNLRTKWISVNK